jgi:hypothetical protein
MLLNVDQGRESVASRRHIGPPVDIGVVDTPALFDIGQIVAARRSRVVGPRADPSPTTRGVASKAAPAGARIEAADSRAVRPDGVSAVEAHRDLRAQLAVPVAARKV